MKASTAGRLLAGTTGDLLMDLSSRWLYHDRLRRLLICAVDRSLDRLEVGDGRHGWCMAPYPAGANAATTMPSSTSGWNAAGPNPRMSRRKALLDPDYCEGMAAYGAELAALSLGIWEGEYVRE